MLLYNFSTKYISNSKIKTWINEKKNVSNYKVHNESMKLILKYKTNNLTKIKYFFNMFINVE